ncbi:MULTISPECIES: hypothetical protein [Arthrobacter]|uniref:Lipoprotein n=1 Tax=Arthrobacter oryzae TaxID=409290 RepID=A0A3N0C3H0_9MICC|nr:MULTISPECIES: hypothetical protein [Arthrobacter]QYF91163.1 hypothetical protein KY499_08290 [Arthrobacter sp. PAMC25284]RNL57170.1 hypothetical protein D7003_07690 [Arthrobacter oryzae]
MNQRTAALLSLAASAALGLSSCAVPGERAGSGLPAGSTAPAASTGSPTPGSGPAAGPTGPAAASAPAATPTSAQPSAVAVTVFTFPDGHVSFSYPSEWSVRVVARGEGGMQATIADASGNELASVTSGTAASDATGPVARTVLDAAPVPGLTGADGGQLSFGFAFDSFADHVAFHMGVRREADFQPATESAGFAHVELPNGDSTAKVIFADPAFDSVDSAKAWMATAQYSQLKRLLLSLSYK